MIIKYFFVVLLSFVLCLPVVQPILSDGFFPMHDDTQVARVVSMGRALLNGQFPVRWISDLGYGYGYPLFNFYGPLPYYVGGFFYALGFSGLAATKIMMVIGMVLPAILMVLIYSSFFGIVIALVAAIVYVYAPYHATQLYVRGAIGELWTLVFFPFLFGSVYATLIERRYRIGIYLGAIGVAGVVLSHTILGFTTVVFFLFFLVFFAIVVVIKKKSVLPFGILKIGLLFGLGLSAFFWLPAIVEMRFISVSEQIGPTANVVDHFVCLRQFWYSPWGYGGSVSGCEDGLSFMLGKLAFFIMVSSGFALLYSWKRKNQLVFVGVFGWGVVLLSIFFMTSLSEFLWILIPGFSYVQYPWRFLAYTAFGISLLTISLVLSIPHRYRYRYGFFLISCMIMIGNIFVNKKFFVPQYLYDRSPASFETQEDLRYRASKISDEYLPPDIPKPKSAEEIIKLPIPESTVYQFKQAINKETYKKFEIMSQKQHDIILQHAHFPGWRYWVNGKEQYIRLDNSRAIVRIPEGFSTIEMRFIDTPVRFIGNIISVLSVLLLVYSYGKKTVS